LVPSPARVNQLSIACGAGGVAQMSAAVAASG
jgi:hypothetical protein